MARTRVPRGYVSTEAEVANQRSASLDEMVADYQQNYGRNRRRSCLVCDSPQRELIDKLMRGGAGVPSLKRYLQERLKVEIGEATLSRHKQLHLDAEDKIS